MYVCRAGMYVCQAGMYVCQACMYVWEKNRALETRSDSLRKPFSISCLIQFFKICEGGYGGRSRYPKSICVCEAHYTYIHTNSVIGNPPQGEGFWKTPHRETGFEKPFKERDGFWKPFRGRGVLRNHSQYVCMLRCPKMRLVIFRNSGPSSQNELLFKN